LIVGCAGNPPTLPETPQLLSRVARAERRPVELGEAQKQEVLKALAGSHGGGAQRFSDLELDRQVWASFWRSPIDMQTDRNRLLLVRYYEDGTYVYVGFGRDGRLFTDGVGALLADPPWSQ
jgi:glycine/D-amino acid oxidase-like deaminating enzyme